MIHVKTLLIMAPANVPNAIYGKPKIKNLFGKSGVVNVAKTSLGTVAIKWKYF